MKNDLDQIFNELHKRFSSTIENKLRNRLKKAKDKEFVQKEIKSELQSINKLLVIESHKRKVLESFVGFYKRGESIIEIITRIKNEFIPEPTVRVHQILDDGKRIPLFDEAEENELRKFAKNDRELIRFFVSYVTYHDLEKRLPSISEEILKLDVQPAQKRGADYSVEWTGIKANKNEFVQLVYALHEAELINNGKGEITKIVEALAETFGVELGKNWQSNHSASIHKAKTDYKPPIFSKILDAYQDYVDGQIEEKKKKK